MKIGPFGSALKKEYFVEEGIKVYAQENAFTGDFSMGDYYITEDKYKELKSCELYPGDLVISMMGTIGACAIFPKNAEKGIMNSHLLRLQFNNEVIPEYIMYLLRDSVLIRKQIDRLSVGSIMSGLSSSVVKKLVFPIPKLAEQKRIVEYLDSIDRLITLHQRKCEEMKILKKYMLQKMFPQNGQLVPQIRFSGFTEDWEQRKLGDIASSFEYGLNAAAKEYDGENKYIRITDIDDNTHEFLTDNLTSPDIDLTGADNYKLTEGDILFARTGASVGKSYIYRNSDGLVYYAGFLIRARIKEEYDAEFVFQNTLTDRYNKYIAVTSQRSGQPGVNAQEYAEFEIEVPKKEEQTKIGTYFRNIDHLITLHQQKCDELRNIKKFMLQNMFI